MPNKNPLFRFWQELKRRKVIYVITVYASAAFVIIELVNNLSEPLNLPESLATIVIIILASGFPLAAILSWIYDLTGEGIERTRPLDASDDEIHAEKGVKQHSAWKLATYISFVVIIGLVTLNLVGNKGKLRRGDIKSMIILPFGNLTGDDQLVPLVSSMHSMLITDIGRLDALRVKGKTTSDTYANSGMSASEIAEKEDVQAVMESDVLYLGTDSICIVFRLLSFVRNEEQLWVYEYREHKSQFLNMFNKVTKQVAEGAMVEISPNEERLLTRSRTIRRETFDNYLMGHSYMGDVSKEALFKARDYLNRAIETDPDYAPIYAGLANVWLVIAGMDFESPVIARQMALKNLDKALELDPDNAYSHYVKAFDAHQTEWDWEKAEMEYLKALASNPNDAQIRVLYAQLLACLQRPGEAVTQGQVAIDLDPQHPLVQLYYTLVLSNTGDYETALAYGEKIVAESGHFLAYVSIELPAYFCGDYDKVMEAAKHILPVKGVDFQMVERVYGESGFKLAYEEALRQLEVIAQNGFTEPVEMAYRYMMVDQVEKALEWLEKGYEGKSPIMPYITTRAFMFEPLFDHPRFIAICEKMNLPFPSVN